MVSKELLTFEEAVSALKLGLCIRREGWVEWAGCFIRELPPKGANAPLMLFLDTTGAPENSKARSLGNVVGYQFSSSDVFEDDWVAFRLEDRT